MYVRCALGLAAGLLLVSSAAAQTIYHNTPDWISSDTQVSTGAALVDLDRDGWLDLVVANGNDIYEQHVAVYYNQGDGTFPSTPDWQSSDNVYNGHLDVADVNADGWPDVAVATLGEFSTTGPIARVYMNNSGTLSSTPDWAADIIGNAFGLAFGDMNNDGRPDLAVATGWAYGTPHQYHNYVYLNVDGALESSASWVSDDTLDTQGALWVDADDDGWLDLALAASNTTSLMYRNLGGTLETTASWQVADVTEQDAIMLTAGDTTGDGRRDLFIADNNQIGGSGRFRQYDGQVGDVFETSASWTYFEGYCSAVVLADLNCDGALDLMTGGWWKPTRLFFNEGPSFFVLEWQSSVTSVIEKICFGDVDRDGLRPASHIYAPGLSGGHLCYLPDQPIQEVTAVLLDDVPLTLEEYHVNREHGWITVAPNVMGQLLVEYTVSSRLEMAVTNWDSDVGNFLYYNQRLVMGDANCDGRVDFFDIEPFVMLLLGGYEEVYPDCDGQTFCDMDGNGQIDFFDIDGFVTVITE